MTASRKLILNCPTSNIEEFSRLADLARELGFTHVVVSHLPKARWQTALDPLDPYPNWAVGMASLFKVCVPESLWPWVSHDHGRRCMAIVAERGEILRQRGLKAAFDGTEPMWLPAGAYEAHPEWRGPRCEHARRAKQSYYAPCIDHPEVLAMYRRAAAELCRAAPVEVFELQTNDSGSGICWSEGLYPGPNGPEQCRSRSMAQRISGFMSAIQDGAKDAGLSAQVEINVRVPPAESEATWPHLREGQVIATTDRHGKPARVAAGFGTYRGRGTGKTATAPGANVVCATFGGYGYASHTYPVIDIPQPLLYAEQLERVFEDSRTTGLVSIPSADCAELFDLVKEMSKRPPLGVEGQSKAVAAVAERRVGKGAAPSLLDAWERIANAVNNGFSHIQYGGPLFMLGTVNQRWLIRPLVPFPLELTLQEKDYYRKYQFQAQGEQQAADLMDLQGTYLIRGTQSTGVTVATREALALLSTGIEELQAARRSLGQALAQARDDAARREIQVLDGRVAALICVTRNAIVTVRYQDFLDRCGPLAKDRQPIGARTDGIPDEAAAIIEADIANTHELIALLESADLPLLDMAADESEEDVFTLGPDLVQQLRRKIHIMREHSADHGRLV